MSRRQPAPYFKKSHKAWYVQIGAKQHRLSDDYTEALARCAELLKAHRNAARFVTPGEPLPFTLGQLATEFLRVAFKDLSPRTRGWYEEKLTPFVRHLGETFPASHLKPLHVEQWVAVHPHWASGTARSVWRAVQRLLSWAERSGRASHSSVCDYAKPKAGRRTVVVSPAEYQRLRDAIRSDRFLDLVTLAWETGARPQELLKLEARHFDPSSRRFVLPPEEAKGGEWPRVIYLPESVGPLVDRLVAERPVGRLLVNEAGKAWTPMSVNCQFVALQHRLGFAAMREQGGEVPEEAIRAKLLSLRPGRVVNGREVTKSVADLREEARLKCRKELAQTLAPKYCLYHLRHSWLDRMLKGGIDALTCAILMGHRDPSTIAKTYQHLAQSPDHLRAALNKRAAG